MLSFHHKCFEEFFPSTTSSSSSSKKSSSTSGGDDVNGGLLVIGRGLGDWRIIVQMFRLCCTPGGNSRSSSKRSSSSTTTGGDAVTKPLVLVINGTSEYLSWKHLCEWWGQIPREYSPKVLDATTLGNKRQSLYAEGGCFFVTTRVLVADLLNGVFKENLAGVLVLKAHHVTESSNEAFVIRMIRQKNPGAFVYAFCDSPERLSSGFARLSTVMKSLGVRKLFLYPRFRQEVRDCLDASSPCLAEIAQPLSNAMREIQSATVEAIRISVDEIRRSASVDVSELTVETALFKPFDVILRQKLLSDWATVSQKSRQLIDDLQTLRHILRDLLLLDCVSFYEKLLDVKRKSAESAHPSMWLLTDAGDRLFRNAKARVYTVDHTNRTLKVVLEPHLKIEALSSVLQEIREKQTDLLSLEMLGGSDVVILVKDEQTLAQVANFLSSKASKSLPLLERRFLNFLNKQLADVPAAATVEQTLLQQEQARLCALRDSLPAPRQSVKMSDTQFHPKHCYVRPLSSSSSSSQAVQEETSDEMDHQAEFLTRTSHTAIHLMSELGPSGLLEQLRPRFVILFDPDVAAMREVECYFATSKHLFASVPTTTNTSGNQSESQMSLYLLYFESSVEEQRYLSNLNQERDAFIRVIQEKSELVFAPEHSTIPQQHTGDGEELAMTYDASTGQMVPVSKKRRGLAANLIQNKVIVDLRELRSILPNMLHSSGFLLDARTLEVGDYILSPDVCVERKAIPDLIDSLRTGRLFKQCTMMTRHYKRPCVLIEFPDAGPFRIQGDVGQEVTQVSLMSRIVLLTLHFPDIRVIWSKSSRATVDIFRELQKNQLPPDGDVAEKIEATGSGNLISDVPNMEAFELLRHLPGITKDNLYRVARGAGSLANLARMDLETITQLCENETNAKILYEFLNREE